MADPIEEGAYLDLLAAMRLISVADGYNYDFKPSSITDRLQEILLVESTEIPFLLLVAPDVGATRRWVEKPDGIRDDLMATVIGRVDENDPTRRRLVGLRLAADIEKAATVDQSRGGVVMETLLETPKLRYGLGDDPVVIVQQPIRMPIYRTYGRPNG